MYHIEFAPKYRRKIAYGKKDIANIKYAMLMKRSKNNRGGELSGSCAYAGRIAAQYKCIKFRRVSKREKYVNDIRETCEFKI